MARRDRGQDRPPRGSAGRTLLGRGIPPPPPSPPRRGFQVLSTRGGIQNPLHLLRIPPILPSPVKILIHPCPVLDREHHSIS